MEGQWVCWNHISWITSQFQPVLKCSDLVQKMQTNSIIISNFNSLCYNIEPRVNKEISFNLLENMLTLFTTVQSFSYAKDIKEKHKIKSNKSKSQSLQREIKKSSSSKDMGYWMLHQIKPVAVSGNDFKHTPKQLFL